MKKHAFLIIAHNEFTMLKKLVQSLDDECNDIYLHIDKKTKYVDLQDISSWVSCSKLVFIPRMKIYWGTYSIVDCELKMLKTAVRGHYDYYHMISGVDLPLQSRKNFHDAFENESSEFVEYHSNGEYGDMFEDKVKYSYPLLKYVGKGIVRGTGIRKKIIRKLSYYQWKYTESQRRRGVDRTKKFPGIQIYKGSQWFSITDDLANYLISKEKLIKKIFRWSNGPDEFFVPTLALNSDFKDRVKNYAFRQIDWERGAPYSYTNDDYDELASCGAFFARKVSYNNEPLLVERTLKKIRSEEQEAGAAVSGKESAGIPDIDPDIPVISVIVPCYNVKDYLKECVDSLLAQTFHSFEILLVDDGSADETGDMVDGYSSEHKNIHAIHKENGGLSSARNAGIDAAQGEYIAFVDSDDLVSEDYLQKLYDAVILYHADMSVCGYEKFENEQGTVAFDEEKVLSGHSVLETLSDIYHRENVLFTVAVNKLYRRELFGEYRYVSGRIHEDEFAAHRLAGASDCIVAIPDVLYRYRIRSGSITSPEKKQDIRHIDYCDGMLDRLKYVRNMYYSDLEKQMAQTNLRALFELMVDYTDETIRKHRVIGWYRRRAVYILSTHLFKMFSGTRKNYIRIALFPRRTVKQWKEERQKENDERNSQSQRNSSDI